MIVHDLSSASVAKMNQVDLANATSPPASPIGEFPFNGCTCGIGSFVGRPPWERHPRGDELLHVLAGKTRLVVLEETGPVSRTLRAGEMAIVPRGRWHNNDAPDGVTMLYVTPSEGNEHSWEEPDSAI